YATVHFPLTLAFLVWMFVRRPDYYLWIRRSLVILTSAALVGHLAFPLAPPRMLPQLGFVDTGVLFNMSVYGADGANSIANQYAAMPSLHVAWAALVAVGLIMSTRTRWRWFWMLHPILTLAVVVVTANHYWLDGIIGLLLLVIALTVTVRARPEPEGDDADGDDGLAAEVQQPAEAAETEAKAPAVAPKRSIPAPVRVRAGSSRFATADTPNFSSDTPRFRR
ncbi:MAG: phosphatase PAP2 family protein, partial [Nocardioidaceae bacterium]